MTNILGLGVVPKFTPDEWSTMQEALSYSSPDGRCPSQEAIWWHCPDKVIRALKRYERHAIPGSVAALKHKLALSR
jgi:hypothetical protein